MTNNGSVRVVSMRKGQLDYGPAKGETVLRIDRVNKVLGNPHRMHYANNEQERTRVINAYVQDSELDWRVGGPRRAAIEALAARVAAGERIALACWCTPLRCHGDWLAQRVRACAMTLSN